MNTTPTSPNVTIRQMLREDGLAFVGLIDALADYENLERPDPHAKARLLADAFSERPGSKFASLRWTALLPDTHSSS